MLLAKPQPQINGFGLPSSGLPRNFTHTINLPGNIYIIGTLSG